MRYIATIVTSLLLAGTASAATINVPGDYPTIQGAVDAANNGDEIIVAPGTYTSTQDGHVVDMKGMAVTLRSSDGPEVTIIDGQNERRGIACYQGETNATVIDGFMVTNCTGVDHDYLPGNQWWEDDAGGILCYSASPTITNCTIMGNTSHGLGGGISCVYSSNPTITDCTISDNTANWDGGGIYCSNNSSPTITNCNITGNTVSDFGGGIYCRSSSSPTITDCTIKDNTSNWSGSGIYCNNSNATISGCTISGNIADGEGGGIFCDYDSNPTITDCTIMGNTANYYGGGISCWSSDPTITGCTISGNTADLGGGIYSYTSNPTITDCTISNNTAEYDGGGIYNYPDNLSNSILSDTIVCGNTPNQIYGLWTNDGGNTVQEICPVFPGACCTGNEIFCVPDVEENDCLFWGGQWLGEATSCDDCPPPVEPDPTGACCISGACVLATNIDCFAGGGNYAGDDVACADAGCPSTCLGDANGDGEVSVNDILLVISQFGVTCP